jgi:hypothetical protein
MTTTRTRLGLIGTALAALIAPLTLAVMASPSEAADIRGHHLTTYKVERQLEIDGQDSSGASLSCDPGDYAVDGTWRVDNVDDPNPQLDMFGDERDVLALGSYGDSNVRTWQFRFHNGADGRAQLKIWVVCLDGRTQTQWNHFHNLAIGPRLMSPLTNVGLGSEVFDSPDACGTDQILVAPGFNITDGTGYNFRSWPNASLRGWYWAFISHHATTDINVYGRCLDVETSTKQGHHHNLLAYFTHGWGGSYAALPVSPHTERQLTCADHYLGAVGAWWINDPHHVWHLGSDPRPVTRAHSFWNDGGGDHGTYLTLRCLGKRTSTGTS